MLKQWNRNHHMQHKHHQSLIGVKTDIQQILERMESLEKTNSFLTDEVKILRDTISQLKFSKLELYDRIEE